MIVRCAYALDYKQYRIATFVVAGLALLLTGCPRPMPADHDNRAKPVVRGYIATHIPDRRTETAQFPLSGEDVYLPNLNVSLLNVQTGVRSDPVTTDLSGRFTFPPKSPGTYRICWDSAGFGSNCVNQTFAVGKEPVFLSKVLIIPDQPPDTTQIVGTVRLADGSLARTLEPMASVNSYARVELLDETGGILLTVPVNNFGEYFLPQVPVQRNITLRAVAEAASFDLNLLPDAELDVSSIHQIDFQIRNNSPRVAPIVATDASGRRVKTTDPGAVLVLDAETSDPDGDSVSLRWVVQSGSGTVSSSSDPTVKWSLPSAAGLYTINLLVADGNGGYARSSLTIRADGLGIPFSGHVSATNAAIVAGAEVEINGQKSITDAGGYFRLFVRDADRFVFNIRTPGYAIYSKIYDDGVTGGQWQLLRASGFSVDPTQPIDLEDKRTSRDCPGPKSARVNWKEMQHLMRATWQDGKGNVIHPPKDPNVLLPWSQSSTPDKIRRCGPGVRVKIGANSLVDAAGNLPPGNVQISIATADLMSAEQMPGDFTVETSAGNRVMQSYGLGMVEISSAGVTYNLAPGATADITIPVDPAQLAAPGAVPATIPLLYYDEVKGVWTEEGTATLVGDSYVATVSHFSALNTDLVKTDQSCVRVNSPALDGNYTLEVTIPQTGGAAPVVRTYAVDNGSPSQHVVYNLPANTNIVLVPIRNSNNIPYGTFVVNTGGPQAPTNPNLPAGPPYDACSTEVVLDEQTVPPVGGEFLKGLSTFSATNLDALAPVDAAALDAATGDYYAQIDPRGKRLTLTGFQTTNSFDGSEIRGVFANSGDLGFGRDMYCKKTGLDVACYVTNYGDEPSPDVDDANDAVAGTTPVASVAMEYSRIESAPGDPVEFDDPERVVKFYVYNADGSALLRAANLDGLGARPIPQLCMVCHNGVYPGGATVGVPPFASRDDVKLGSRFIAFDISGFTFPTVAGFDKATQQSVFKDLNEQIVAATEPAASSINEVITAMYNPGPDQNESFVVSGWNAQPNEAAMYREVVAPACRTCHAANVFTGLQFTQASQIVSLLGQAEVRVCVDQVMPHALRTHSIFWTSTGPHMPAQFQVFGDAFGSIANGWQGNRCGVFTAGGVTPDTFYDTTIQPIWDGVGTGTSSCTGCHIGAGGSAGLNLGTGASHANLVNVASTQLPGMDRVEPNNVSQSYLIHKLEGTQGGVGGSGVQMPFAASPLADNPHIDSIKTWINDGATE